MTHEAATLKYEAAKSAFVSVSRAHDKVVADYRSRVVGDDVYLESRARFQAAIRNVDDAEAAMLAAKTEG